MEGVYLERTCFYIGFWKDDTVADNIIRQVATKVRNGSGTKCKLHLSGEGLKVTTSSVLSRSHLKDVLPFDDIYFATSNQYNPECLLFFAKDDRRRYRITAFRCKTEADVAFFVSCFKDLRIARKGKGNNIELKQVEGGNWTLRAKSSANTKRQLNKIVDINSNTNALVKQNGILKVKNVDVNSNLDISVEAALTEAVLNIERKNSSDMAVQTTNVETHNRGMYNDTPGKNLQDELSHLSQELRDIKLELETSAGLGSNGQRNREKDLNDNKMDAEIIEETYHSLAINDLAEDKGGNAKILDLSENSEELFFAGKDGQIIEDNLNLSKNTTSSSEGEIKLAVPDYRKLRTESTSKYERRYVPKTNSNGIWNGESNRLRPNGIVNNSPRSNGDVSSRVNSETHSPRINGDLNSPRSSTATSFNTWKEDVVLRKSVTPRGTRPRSAYLSTSSYDSGVHGSLRDRDVIYTTPSRTHHSLRVPLGNAANRSSTVERPIEKVYPRPRSVHGSIIYRPASTGQRGTVYAIPTTKKFSVNTNQNKVDLKRQPSNSVPRKGGTVIIKT